MKHIYLKCDRHGCEMSFLIVMNDWYNQEYEGEVRGWYICPNCGGLVWTDDDCIVEI